MSILAYIGIGSNLDDPVRQVKEALVELEALPDSILAAHSSLYRSKPMGPADQPDYINAVAALETLLSADELLKALQRIEDLLGRERSAGKWAPRSMDLDLLLYGRKTIRTDTLTIPHPGMHERDFVIIPLHEIAGNITVPGHGQLSALIANCANHSVTQLVTGK